MDFFIMDIQIPLSPYFPIEIHLIQSQPLTLQKSSHRPGSYCSPQIQEIIIDKC